MKTAENAAHAAKPAGDADQKSTNGASQEQLISDFKAVVADTEALLKATANQGGEKLDEVRAQARQSLRVVRARLISAEDHLLARTREAAQATDVYVHENPWQAIGIAGGLGVLIGLLLRRA